MKSEKRSQYVEPEIHTLSAAKILEALGPVSAGSIRVETIGEENDSQDSDHRS